MAEALAIVGIIANIIALVDLGVEIYDRAKSIGGDIRDVPKAFQNVCNKLPLVKVTLIKMQEKAESGGIGEDESKTLKESLEGCLKHVEDLHSIFKKALPAKDASRWSRGWKAVSSLRCDAKIQAIDKAMMDTIIVLTGYHSAETATATQLAEAIKTLTMKTEEAPRKQLSMVRYQKVEAFIGRTDIINEIERRFKIGNQRVAIAGIGGVGKSSIAIEYCYQYRSKNPNDNIFWIHGGTKARMEAAYKEIADQMKIPGCNEPNVDILKLVSDWLSQESNGHWLMVLDNADDAGIWTDTRGLDSADSPEPSIPLERFLPRKSSILITTRNRHVGRDLTRKLPILVPIFGSEDAVSLLRSRILDNEVADGDAEELTQQLDYLPLAVTQAAAYLDQNDIQVAEYLELVRASKADTSELLIRENHDDSRDPDIHNAVFQTWKISFDQILKQSPRASELISLMAMLDRQAVSVDLLRDPEEKELDFKEAIQKLIAYSLIVEESRGKTYSMHRIVQLSIGWLLEKEKMLQYWQEKAICSVDDRFPPHGSYKHWREIEALNPHAEIVLEYTSPEKSLQIRKARLMFVLGDYNSQRGFLPAAERFLSDSVDIFEKNSGSDKTDLVDALGELAYCLNEMGRYTDAEEAVCSALDIARKEFSEGPSTTLLQLRALILSKMKNYLKAEEHFQQALALEATKGGLTSLETSTIKHNLAAMYNDQGLFSKAEKLYREALNTKSKVLGREDPSTLTALSNLADVLGHQRNFEEQEKLCREVFLLRSKVLGALNPRTLQSMHGLANSLHSLERYGEAEGLARDALKFQIQVLSLEDEGTLITMNLLAVIFKDAGEWMESEELFRKTLRLATKALGVENEITLNAMHNLASTLIKLKKYDEAEEHFKETLRLRRKILGTEHEYILKTMHQLAFLLIEAGKYQLSEDLGREILRLRRKVLGAEHQDTLVTMHNLACTLGKHGKYEEAKEVAEKCLELNLRVYGPGHSKTTDAEKLLAGIFSALERRMRKKK